MKALQLALDGADHGRMPILSVEHDDAAGEFDAASFFGVPEHIALGGAAGEDSAITPTTRGGSVKPAGAKALVYQADFSASRARAAACAQVLNVTPGVARTWAMKWFSISMRLARPTP